ncbi:hypothetical protein NQ314_008013 [Rhamnusium bicolor]|uniref:Toll-like receptor 3 n=1 Tax=Rhamnusium bicolor TaxID=1586634 RepID=A0AAV8YGG6_9CUCU|nr:hypothetical protein NQ314_008013 [Rhamnusium bicolor]
MLDVDSLICTLLEELSINLSLANNGFFGKSLAPVCKALNYQTSLLELDLSGNFVDTDCIIKLCSSLPTLTNLCVLNLRSTGLVSSHLAELVKVFTSISTPVLQKLSSLDLSDNFLRDKSLLHLSQITRHLKLTNINLSNVRFTGNIFKEMGNDNIQLNLSEIHSLDLSDNELGTDDINKFISWTSPGKLCFLNVSRNDSGNQGILGTLIDVIRDNESDLELKSLDLSRCNVQESELYEFLR